MRKIISLVLAMSLFIAVVPTNLNWGITEVEALTNADIRLLKYQVRLA